MTADPVKVIERMLVERYNDLTRLGHSFARLDANARRLIATEAVAALKANPEALAELLVRSGIAYRAESGEWVPLVEYPESGREKVDLYRLPDPS